MEKQYDVFLSYARKDSEIASMIFSVLSEAGLRPYMDKGMKGGKDFLLEMAEKIEESTAFMFLASKNSYEANYAPDEVAYAKTHKERGRLYCYIIDNSNLPKMFEIAFAAINQRRMSEIPIGHSLVEDVKHIIDPSPKPKPLQKIKDDVITFAIGSQKLEMIRVEGGMMRVGATEEQVLYAESEEYPPHLINLNTFYISRYPITQAIWKFVMAYNKSHYNSAKVRNSEQHPAENLTHDDAKEFVRRISVLKNISFSLPTEDEWEYAARGGQKSLHYLYAGSNDIDEVAWYRDNADGSTHPVGEKKPNELGLYDMSGNVWEWTETPAYSYDVNVIPEGDCFSRRGGSWAHKEKNCRVSKRYFSDHKKKTSGLGLRVVIREDIEL